MATALLKQQSAPPPPSVTTYTNSNSPVPQTHVTGKSGEAGIQGEHASSTQRNPWSPGDSTPTAAAHHSAAPRFEDGPANPDNLVNILSVLWVSSLSSHYLSVAIAALGVLRI